MAKLSDYLVDIVYRYLYNTSHRSNEEPKDRLLKSEYFKPELKPKQIIKPTLTLTL